MIRGRQTSWCDRRVGNCGAQAAGVLVAEGAGWTTLQPKSLTDGSPPAAVCRRVARQRSLEKSPMSS
jgi:hypothetical protein